MDEKKSYNKNTNKNKEVLDYSQELVMLNYLHGLKLLSEDEMLCIKRDILKSYRVKESVIS